LIRNPGGDNRFDFYDTPCSIELEILNGNNVINIDQLIKVKPFFKIVLKVFLDEPALLYKKGMANKPSTCRKLT
jgi:hypothetical protein